MATIIFHGQFIDTKVGKNGLTVTVDVERITRSDGTRSALVTGASATEVTRRGLYYYRLTGADLTLYDYIATFITSNTDVDQREIAALWTLFSLSWHDIATSIMTVVGSIGKLLVDNINATISSRSTLAQSDILSDGTPFAGEYIDAAISGIAASVWGYVTRTLTGYVVTGVDEAALGVAEDLADFFPGETVNFSITCTIEGVAQDITGDTVKLYMKRKRTDSDANAVLTKTADVATQGASGIANFTIDPSDTAELDPQTYAMDIVWILAGGDEYVIHDQSITLLRRVSDA